MTKRLVFLLVALYTLQVFAWNSSPLADQNGEYVVYRDRTWTTETYVGFLYYSDTTYALMLKTPDVKTSVLVTATPKNGTLSVSGARIIDGDPSDTHSVNYLLSLFQELVDIRFRISDGDFPAPIAATQYSDLLGGHVSLTFRYYIPLFNLERIIAVEHNNDVSLELVRIGRMTSDSDRSFYDFEPATYDPEAESKYEMVDIIVTEKKIPVSADGITIQLDAQWGMADANHYFLKDDKKNAAMVTLQGIDGAAAGISDIYEFVRLFTRSTPGLAYNPAATEITITDTLDGGRSAVITNTVIDTANGVRNASTAVITSGSGTNANFYAMITLSVVEPVYQVYRTYFTEIIR